MKNIFVLSVVILTTAILSAQKVEYSYKFAKYQISDKKNYQIVEIPGTVQMAQPGDPAIPMAPVCILLPQAAIATNIEFIYDNKQKIASNIELLPMQNVRPYSDNGDFSFVKNENTYKQNVYPLDKNYVFSNQMMNGFGFVISRFSPVEYNPQTKGLFLYTDVKVIIDYNSNDQYNSLMLSSSPIVLEQVAKFAQNPETIKLYDLNTNRTNTYDVLIICSSNYVSSMQPLINYYTNLGLISKVVSLSTINSTMTGVDEPQKMRNYIIQEYQNYGISYVTLAGDADLVPYRGLYCSVQSSSVYTDNSITSDVYFSGLDRTCNTNNNSLL